MAPTVNWQFEAQLRWKSSKHKELLPCAEYSKRLILILKKPHNEFKSNCCRFFHNQAQPSWPPASLSITPREGRARESKIWTWENQKARTHRIKCYVVPPTRHRKAASLVIAHCRYSACKQTSSIFITLAAITLQEKGLLDKNAARSWIAFLTTTTDLSLRRPTASDTTDWNWVRGRA